jgi:hypothetical protein
MSRNFSVIKRLVNYLDSHSITYKNTFLDLQIKLRTMKEVCGNALDVTSMHGLQSREEFKGLHKQIIDLRVRYQLICSVSILTN